MEESWISEKEQAKLDSGRGFFRFAYGLCSVVVRLFYRVSFLGTENLPQDGKLILYSNHLSLLDPVFLLLAVKKRRSLYFMGKAEIFRVPVLRTVVRKLGCFPVKRGTGGADALQHAGTLLQTGHMVGVFIEGTRSRTGNLLQPKTGVAWLAKENTAPVFPVCITTKDGKKPHLFGRVIVHFGQKIPFADLGFTVGDGRDTRRCTRALMEHIRVMREEDSKAFEKG